MEVKGCRALDGWDGNRPATGREEVSPEKTTVYTLICTGEEWSLLQSVTVVVNDQPAARR